MTEINRNQELNNLTKDSLQTALIQLMDTEDLDQISITQLTKRAGVSRMAYYRNYDSLSEIFSDILDEIFYDLLDRAKHYLPQGQWGPFWLELLQVVHREGDLARVLFKDSGHEYVLSYLNERLLSPQLSTQERYLRRSFIGSIYNVLTEWAQNDFDLTPEELAAIINQISYDDLPLEQLRMDLP